MKAVVDTNVWVSGFLWRGEPGRLLEAVAEGLLTPVVSEVLLAELAEVLADVKFVSPLRLRRITGASIVAKTRAISEVVEPFAGPLSVVLRDPDDEAVVRCAMAGRVDAIVTGDNDLLSLGAVEGIPIIKARRTLEVLGMT